MVFISWSEKGSPSHDVAKLLKEWLPRVIQKLPCFLSSHDIVAGASWLPELFAKLDESNLGIICLTRSSMSRPWLTFEAGAVAKRLGESNVCPLLIDLEESDVQFPLAAFQMVTTAKDEMRRLLDTINTAFSALALPKEELDEVFELRWPAFEEKMAAIRKKAPHEKQKARPQGDILEEILTLARGIASGKTPVSAPQERPPARFKESEPVGWMSQSIDVWRRVCMRARKDRPLISGWLQSASDALIVNGHLKVYFPKDLGLALDACKRPNNRSFIQEALGDTCEELGLVSLTFSPELGPD